MESNQRRVISLLVDNQSGVLARVSNLFCRRGFNIDSLTVSATNDPTVSRITVSVSGTEKELQQLILQTERLEVTRQVFVLNESTALERELLLLKVMANVTNRAELREIAGIYKAKIIDLSPDSMVFELTGREDRRLLEAHVRLSDPGAVPHRRHRPRARRDASAYAEARAGGKRGTVPAARHEMQLNLSVSADALPPLLSRRGLGISENFISSPEAPLGRGAVERMRD